MESSIPDGELKIDESLISRVHSEQMHDDTESFFKYQPYLNPIAMDMYLSLNKKYLAEIKEQRAQRILQWGLEVSREQRQ